MWHSLTPPVHLEPVSTLLRAPLTRKLAPSEVEFSFLAPPLHLILPELGLVLFSLRGLFGLVPHEGRRRASGRAYPRGVRREPSGLAPASCPGLAASWCVFWSRLPRFYHDDKKPLPQTHGEDLFRFNATCNTLFGP